MHRGLQQEPPRPAPGHRGLLVTAIVAGTISGPATRRPLSHPSRESYRQYPLQPRPAAVMFAPCLLGCPGTTRQHLASSDTVTCAIADYPVENGMESTDLIAEQRTLNLRVRVQVPGGAPVLTWLYSRLSMCSPVIAGHRWGIRGVTRGRPGWRPACPPLSPARPVHKAVELRELTSGSSRRAARNQSRSAHWMRENHGDDSLQRRRPEAAYSIPQASHDRRMGEGIGAADSLLKSLTTTLFMASAAMRACSSACWSQIGRHTKTTMLSCA
jgi:hypothetical protein